MLADILLRSFKENISKSGFALFEAMGTGEHVSLYVAY
jgi:hypothetical protein